MTSGKASGEDREYQVLCRDILIKISQDSLSSVKGDGVDVNIEGLGGTNITFDIALQNEDGDITVAECKRWNAPIPQNVIFAFAKTVELLRESTGRRVAGMVFAKRQFQAGAVKSANWSGIRIALLEQDQSIKDFHLVYLKYDKKRAMRIQEAIAKLSGEIRPESALSIKVFHKDRPADDIGRVK